MPLPNAIDFRFEMKKMLLKEVPLTKKILIKKSNKKLKNI